MNTHLFLSNLKIDLPSTTLVQDFFPMAKKSQHRQVGDVSVCCRNSHKVEFFKPYSLAAFPIIGVNKAKRV